VQCDPVNRVLNHLFRFTNALARRLPPTLRRRIADFPGVLVALARLARNRFETIVSPEGIQLSIYPLYHANLMETGSLEGYEPDMRQAIRVLTKPGMVAYDLGANVGVFSILFASLVQSRGLVYAFEPEPNNYTCLRRTIEQNGLGNIVLDTRAVGRESERGVFDRRGGAFSGRLLGKDAKYEASTNLQTVETVSIDALIADEGYRPPAIMKIDIEGNEGLALEGMQRTLRDYSPVLIIELHWHLGDPIERVSELLARNGYGWRPMSDVVRDGLLSPGDIASTPPVRHMVASRRQPAA
jgi:FkbM family methyltransferase